MHHSSSPKIVVKQSPKSNNFTHKSQIFTLLMICHVHVKAQIPNPILESMTYMAKMAIYGHVAISGKFVLCLFLLLFLFSMPGCPPPHGNDHIVWESVVPCSEQGCPQGCHQDGDLSPQHPPFKNSASQRQHYAASHPPKETLKRFTFSARAVVKKTAFLRSGLP